jgi:RNA polymerase sigma-70 factor (ECF subfamily)
MNSRSLPRVQPPSDEAQRRQDDGDIALFLGGEARGLEALTRRYFPRAYGIALGLTGNHDDAMDAAQRAFVKIMHALPRFRVGEPFFPWLYRIVRNCALNQRRDERRHRGDVPLEWVTRPDAGPTALEAATAEELRERLWDGIQRLPDEQREVFLLYHFQGLKYREIAAALDVPLGTVMSRLYNARLRLRELLEKEGFLS